EVVADDRGGDAFEQAHERGVRADAGKDSESGLFHVEGEGDGESPVGDASRAVACARMIAGKEKSRCPAAVAP
ncbi:MAG TPA: hypothetical protein VFJ62_10940, partial [Usitatibacter sp.]|nr:hypothetical protein [Usitatibacter sp.]